MICIHLGQKSASASVTSTERLSANQFVGCTMDTGIPQVPAQFPLCLTKSAVQQLLWNETIVTWVRGGKGSLRCRMCTLSYPLFCSGPAWIVQSYQHHPTSVACCNDLQKLAGKALAWLRVSFLQSLSKRSCIEWSSQIGGVAAQDAYSQHTVVVGDKPWNTQV